MKTLFEGSERQTSKTNINTLAKINQSESEIVYIQNVIMYVPVEPTQSWIQNGFRHVWSTMILMLALARITEGMKGTQLSLAIVLYTSQKPLITSTGNAYFIYFMAYGVSGSSEDYNRMGKV